MHFQRELFSQVFDEALPLFKEHYLEVGSYFDDIDFDLDIESYIKLDEAGVLRLYTARSVEGFLIGYCIHHVSNHLHFCKSLQAIQDSIFILPQYRGRGLGSSFINWIDDELKGEGVEAVYHFVNRKCEYSKSLKALGYHYLESVYLKRLH